ncbi:adenine-specific methyltransferase EcoRI family protein [Candidatus Gracilibacteria bacterium]|nr:adenine-specific methyltransferase EcoRI family protein [Candidatus Gracilibacteria bacterium]
MSQQKSGNKDLHSAKLGKNDEFYTQLSDIEKELRHYKDHFRGKVIFCNCDDPEESHFWKYFSENFSFLGLKKLISTHYETKKPSYKLEIVADTNSDGQINKLDTLRTPLEQNGDFRSPECIEILKESDIVVTNPPFSLFREYVAQLMEHKKKFLILGSINAVKYAKIFPLIKENKIWAGHGFNLSLVFRSPYENNLAANTKFCEQKGYFGKNYIKTPAINWFTNLDYKKRHEDLILYKLYSETEYQKYDNYDAINVDKVKDIPLDYSGYIGVPITFLGSYNPEQFEIIGLGQGNLYRELTPNGLRKKFVDDYYKNGGTGSITENHPILGYYNKDGKAVIPYMRIIIRNKKLNP